MEAEDSSRRAALGADSAQLEIDPRPAPRPRQTETLQLHRVGHVLHREPRPQRAEPAAGGCERPEPGEFHIEVSGRRQDRLGGIVKRRRSIADNAAMRIPGSPRSHGFSPWWALLILPVAAAIGWGIGQTPAPPPPEPKAAAERVAAGEVHEASPGGTAPAVPSEAGAATAPRPDPPVREELSSWMGYSFAMDESRRTGKPILLDFNAEWCGPCRMMKQQVFDDRGYGRSVQLAVIPVSVVDRVREDGRNSDEVESLMRRFRIEAFPTLVVYSPETGRSEESRGFGGAEYTVDWITRAARSVR